MDKDVLLESVRVLACRAGEEIARIYNDDSAWVQHKADGSPLTAADMAAQKVIVDGLARLTPDMPLVSEESALPTWEERRRWPSYWLVDPLDGTKEFVARTGEFTVNIALIEKGEPVLGVVVAPMFDLSYVARVGGPAKRICRGQAQTIHVRPLGQPLVLIVSRRHGKGRDAVFASEMESRFGEVERSDLGSSLKMCRIAEGGADIYPRLGPTCEWDTAAADAVLRAAGGCLVDATLAPLRYNKESLLNPEFVAINGADDWNFLPSCWPPAE
jgi:3'(2'), 5'-bisphosphate nucleotidase